MAQVIDMVVDDRSFKEKFESWKYDVKQKAHDAKTWVVNHPQETIGGILLTLAVVSEGRRIATLVINQHNNRVNRLTVYCNDVSGKARLKHELNYRELRELRDRMSMGQTRFEALDDMGLLK